MVIAFHARLPLPGGFVGVDAFFVISGFVITAMLQREWLRLGRIHFFSFWSRRFIRLTPALALLVSVTLLLSAVILFPDQQRIAVQTGLGAIFISANLVVARTTGGYFDGPAESNPLLNTWSLSVEEQFYLMFPFVLALGWAVARRGRGFRWAPLLLVSMVGAGSFALAVFSHSDFALRAGFTWLNFYSPVVRAWEFAVGAMLVILLPRIALGSRKLAVFLGSLGLIGLIASGAIIDRSIPFPGPWTLLPVGATLLLLLAGTQPGNAISGLLSTRPLVKLGDWSYSIYLWHWPFIVFAIYLGVENPVILGFVALVSFAPALASFHWIENPIRAWSGLSRPKFLTLVGAVLAVPIATALVVTFALQPNTLHEGDLGADYLSYIDQHSYPCSLQNVTDSSYRCRQTQPNNSVQVALIGDSHAEDLFPGLMDARPETNMSYMYWPNWPLTTSEESKAAIEEIAVSPSIKSVVIGVRWTPEGWEIPTLQESVTRLTSAGKQVFIADGRPYFSFHPRECKYQRLASILRQRCEDDSAKILGDYAATLANIRPVVSSSPTAHLLETARGFCRPGICSMLQDGKLVMADEGHLNVLGSRYVANRLLESDEAFASAMEPVLEPAP